MKNSWKSILFVPVIALFIHLAAPQASAQHCRTHRGYGTSVRVYTTPTYYYSTSPTYYYRTPAVRYNTRSRHYVRPTTRYTRPVRRHHYHRPVYRRPVCRY